MTLLERAPAASPARSCPAARSRANAVARPLPTAAPSSPAGSARRRSASLRALGLRDARRLTLVTAGFTIFGLVMVLSSSSLASISQYGSPWSLFERQVMWTVLGVIAYFIAARIPLLRWRQLALPLLLGSIALLVVVLAPGIGKVAGGSSRWIGAGPIRIQPSELVKLTFAFFAADLVARRALARDQLREILKPIGFVLGVACILIIKQPDLGTAIVLVCIALAICFVGGVRTRLLVSCTALLTLAAGAAALAAPYRRDRLFSFINPFAHASGSGYQEVQSLVALGSGHLTGTGIGSPGVTWGLLPNAETDYIFAVVGNELGLIGAVLVVVGFVTFGWLGIRVAVRAEDRFASLLAAGITCWVVAQALINIGGVLGVFPETGIPLPFLSFGGSSLVVVLGATGVLTRIACHHGVAAAPASTRRPIAPASGRPPHKPR